MTVLVYNRKRSVPAIRHSLSLFDNIVMYDLCRLLDQVTIVLRIVVLPGVILPGEALDGGERVPKRERGVLHAVDRFALEQEGAPIAFGGAIVAHAGFTHIVEIGGRVGLAHQALPYSRNAHRDLPVR